MPALTPGSWVQSNAQLPQCCGSVERLEQTPLQRVSWQPASWPGWPPSPPPGCPESPLVIGFEPQAPRVSSREAASNRSTSERLGGGMTFDYTTAGGEPRGFFRPV